MIPDTVLGMFELSNDLLYGKIPPDQYRYYVGESLRLGREAAERTKGWGDIFWLYEEAGIQLVYQKSSGENYGVSFRAQSEYGKDGSASVLIYTQSIADLAKHSRMELTEHDIHAADPGIEAEQALEIHLAHEYFHYLEYHSGDMKDEKTMPCYSHGFVSEYLEQVQLLKIFGRKRSAGILRCSEIAAHAFAKEMTGIAVLPNYYDYTYLIANGKLRREDFLRQAELFETLL